VLDFAQDTDDKLRYRTRIFQDEHPITFYAPPIGGKSNETVQLPYFTRAYSACPKLIKGIISNCDKGLVNDIIGGILNVLNGNIKLTDCNKRKLKKYKTTLRTLIDKSKPLAAKKPLIIQKGVFLLPLLTAVLRTLANLIFLKSSNGSN
jgi:hypothetical protein